MGNKHIGDNFNFRDVTGSSVIINKNIIRLLPVIILMIIIVIVLVMSAFGIKVSDIENFVYTYKKSPTVQVLEKIKGTYVDDSGNSWVFSPMSLSQPIFKNMDGTIYINGEIAMGYKLYGSDSIYFTQGPEQPIPLSFSGRDLVLVVENGQNFTLKHVSNDSTVPIIR